VKWLSILFKVLSWRVLFLLSIFYTSNVNSEECDPDFPNTVPLTSSSWSGWNSAQFPTAQTSCQDCARIEATVGSCSEYAYEDHVLLTGNTYQCKVHRISNPVVIFTAGNTSLGDGCPDGYTSNGSQCINDCSDIECDDPGTSAGESFWNGSKGVGACVDGCAIQADAGCISVTSAISGITTTSCTQTSFTGQLCNDQPDVVVGANVKDDIAVPPENDPPQSTQDCSPGTGFAQVNNETMCLPSGTTIDGDTTTSTSDGGTTTETTTTTINPDGTTTTETTSSFTDDDGNTISGTTTTQGGINQAGSGSGNNPDNNGLGPAPTFDASLPDEPEINILSVPTPTLSMDVFSNSASCPAPITFSAMDQDFEISFDSVCDFADVIRGVILLLSAIAAIRIIVKD
jgi:Neisseria meningitidis TspB protein